MKLIIYFFLLFISLFISIICHKPVIGFYGLVEPISDYQNYTKEAIDGNLLRWVESAGAEVVVIHIWYSEQEISNLLSHINGVFFQAAARRPLKYDEPWEKKARFVFEYAKSKFMPVWGTCLGMQMITVFMSGDDKLLEKYEDLGLKEIEFTLYTENSSLYSLLKKKDFENLKKEKSNYYIHSHGISPDKFLKNKNLTENFDIIGYGYDNNGKKFVNVVQSKKNKKHKIYGTQYHPEKNPYERNEQYNAENKMDSLRRSQLIAIKFIEEARKNTNRFISYTEKSQYTFVNTYQAQNGQTYDQKANMYYFSKN